MFYTFRQNNSGGSFVYDRSAGIAVTVIVEAESVTDANLRAGKIGLYFDGDGDCECCGSRWDEQYYRASGDNVPSEYETPVNLSARPPSRKGDNPYHGFVHYLDGSQRGYYNS